MKGGRHMEELNNILKGLQEITSENALVNLTDDCLFEQSVKIYLSEKIQESKKQNIKEMKKPAEAIATDKQLYVLKKLQVPFPEGLSKLEASKIINENLKQKTNKGEYL